MGSELRRNSIWNPESISRAEPIRQHPRLNALELPPKAHLLGLQRIVQLKTEDFHVDSPADKFPRQVTEESRRAAQLETAADQRHAHRTRRRNFLNHFRGLS